ncbi:MAG: MarR family winged helix-turn-helix transcriptional regulator [Halocynthiibacter sp.]
MSNTEGLITTGTPTDLPPEVNILMGIYMSYWKIDEVVEQINIMSALNRNERQLLVNLAAPRRMKELASEMQILPSTLTAVANGLEERDLLIRERDPDDRRSWFLTLTDSGIQKRHALLARAVEVFTEISGLNATEIAELSTLMQKITHNIKANGLPEGAKLCS